MTRRRKRVGCGAPPFCVKKLRSLAGTVTVIWVLVALSALTNRARPPSRLNTTKFLPLPDLYDLPLMTSLSLMPTFSGETLLTVGYVALDDVFFLVVFFVDLR